MQEPPERGAEQEVWNLSRGRSISFTRPKAPTSPHYFFYLNSEYLFSLSSLVLGRDRRALTSGPLHWLFLCRCTVPADTRVAFFFLMSFKSFKYLTY